jgi:hypothetical protein
MKVALYNSHHKLPFWREPGNPTCLFDPAILDGWIYEDDEIEEGMWGTKEKPIAEHFMFPVLNGLLAIDLPGVMAHVSLIFDTEKKIMSCPKRVWVQITTEPSKEDEAGLPIIVKEGIVQVEDLYGEDGDSYTPYQLLEKDPAEGEDTADIWTAFFLRKLHEKKEEACAKANDEIAKNRCILQKYSLIK